MRQKLKKILLTIALMMAPLAASSAVNPVILGINYVTGDTVIHIGSAVTVFMSAILPSQNPVNVSVTASTPGPSGSIQVGASLLAGLPTGPVYITDGNRVWTVAFTTGGTTITFDNNSLLYNTPPFTVPLGDYTSIANNTFWVYAGTLIRATTPGSPQMTVDLGSFDNILLSDNGAPSAPWDNTAGDGLWTGVYNVPELGYSVVNAKFFGQCVVNNLTASNGPYQSVPSFSIDGVRPQITTIAFTTNKSNYLGVMYLAKSSQGFSNADPTNSEGRFDVEVNKTGSIVDIVINSPIPKALPAMVIPASAATPTGWRVWRGDNGVGNYLADGIYTASLYVRDNNGVVGLTRTTELRVVSVKMQITNITMTPSGITTQPAFSNSIITNVNYQVRLTNDNGTSMRTSFNTLNWDPCYVPDFQNNNNADSWVYDVGEVDFLDAAGSVVIPNPGHDWSAGYDSDNSHLRGAQNFAPNKAYYGGSYSGCTAFATRFIDYPPSFSPGATVSVGDGATENDWDTPSFARYVINSGTNMDPAVMVTNRPGINYLGATPKAGSYRLRIRAILSGLGYYINTSAAQDTPDPVSPTAGSVYYGQHVHFYPTSRPEGPTTFEGLGIFEEDTSHLFTVSASNNPVSDTTPPFLVTSNPQDGTTQIPPGTYGPATATSPANPITAQVQDAETFIDFGSAGSQVTYSRLKDPYGGYVAGTSATNGGATNNTATISFTPSSPVSTPGNYTFQVFACNKAGLCMQKSIAFNIRDQTAPDVVAVELVSLTSPGLQPLTMNQSAPDSSPNFSNIKELWVTLSVPSSSANVIDWANSSATLDKMPSSGSGSPSNVPMGTPYNIVAGAAPSDNRLKYRLSSPITTAGLYRVTAHTKSTNAKGISFDGPPATFIPPRFITVANPNSVFIYYSSNPGLLALTASSPLSVTIAPGVGSGTFSPTSNNTTALLPSYASLPGNPTYAPITSSVTSAYGLQFNYGAGNVKTTGVWTYASASPLRFSLYYDVADLMALPVNTTVTPSTLQVWGFDGGSWQVVPSSSYTHTFSKVSGVTNSFVIDIPSGNTAYGVYGIFYSSVQAGSIPLPTATAVPFKATRSFNPTSSNALVRKAKFYYMDAAIGVFPKEVEVKVYDTAGTMVKTLTLGSGVRLSDLDIDAVYSRGAYFFNWDGTNDTGNLVKNGIYLVRYRVTKTDGSSESQTKIVALIK